MYVVLGTLNVEKPHDGKYELTLFKYLLRGVIIR